MSRDTPRVDHQDDPTATGGATTATGAQPPLRGGLYFGCVETAGHYLWDESLRYIDHLPRGFPWTLGKLDGGLIPAEALRGPQGVAYLTHAGLWTFVNFADRSVDHRHGSHSLFCLPGKWSDEAALAEARARFPRIWQRFTFTVTLRDKA